MPGMTEDEILATQWMFQYNPYWYDLEKSSQHRLTEDWVMFRHRPYVRVGQHVFFMKSSGGRGKELRAITAVGRISSPIFEKPDAKNEQQRYFVDVVYDYLVVPNLMQPEILADEDEELRAYKPYVEGFFAAAFRLPPAVAQRTEQLVRDRLVPIGTSHLAVDKRVFVSHSHADNEFGVKLVHGLRRALGGREETVWYDASGGLHGGDAWWREIMENIKARPVFIVVVSPDSMKSKWVDDEITLAWRLKNNAPGGKLIVPVLYRKAEMRDDLALRQAVSFLQPRPFEDALKELVAVVNQAK